MSISSFCDELVKIGAQKLITEARKAIAGNSLKKVDAIHAGLRKRIAPNAPTKASTKARSLHSKLISSGQNEKAARLDRQFGGSLSKPRPDKSGDWVVKDTEGLTRVDGKDFDYVDRLGAPKSKKRSKDIYNKPDKHKPMRGANNSASISIGRKGITVAKTRADGHVSAKGMLDSTDKGFRNIITPELAKIEGKNAKLPGGAIATHQEYVHGGHLTPRRLAKMSPEVRERAMRIPGELDRKVSEAARNRTKPMVASDISANPGNVIVHEDEAGKLSAKVNDALFSPVKGASKFRKDVRAEQAEMMKNRRAKGLRDWYPDSKRDFAEKVYPRERMRQATRRSDDLTEKIKKLEADLKIDPSNKKSQRATAKLKAWRSENDSVAKRIEGNLGDVADEKESLIPGSTLPREKIKAKTLPERPSTAIPSKAQERKSSEDALEEFKRRGGVIKKV